MVKNKYDVYIDGILYTHYAVMPLKSANLLDERLDECYLSLRKIPVEVFSPLTPVKIIKYNTVCFNENIVAQNTETKYFYVANDNSVVENPVGSGRYDHDLYLLETTKLAECIIVDSLSFTNDLGRNYVVNQKMISPDLSYSRLPINEYRDPEPQPTYVTPVETNTILKILPCSQVFALIPSPGAYVVYTALVTFSYSGNSNPLWVGGLDDSTEITLESLGTYTLTYEITQFQNYPNQLGTTQNKTAKYSFIVVDNYYPLKKITVTDVINRLLQLSKNLYQTETPAIVLNAEQEELFNNVYSPEMTFTQKTLRECLQDCGKIIHGEPRLTPIEGATTAPFYTLSYDLYGGTEQSNIYTVPYITKTVSQVINGYCTHIDSNAQNLVNQLDYILNNDNNGGTITEPYNGGYRTLRTETLYVRVDETTGIIYTQFPIQYVEKIVCGYIPPNGTQTNIDITPYLFEKRIYDAQLSSYQDVYPLSKAYGIYYSQGENNIYGLNFKPEAAILPAFQEYAIINILQKATGDSSISATSFPILAFQITYKPIYNVRVTQSKSYYPDYKYEAGLIYNQQSNLIEAQYYGENLKGVVERLGTVDKTYTYYLSRLNYVPKAGQMFDDDYYISAVSEEFDANYIKVTIALSKNFNRLSEYIGVSSNLRMYEVSERQAYERNVLYNEYVVVGTQETPDENCLIGQNAVNALADLFNQQGSYTPISSVIAWGGSYSLPVGSSAQEDITSQVSAQISSDGKSIIFTITGANGNVVNVSGTFAYGTGSLTSSFSFSTENSTYTYTPGIGNNSITSIVTYSATENVFNTAMSCVRLPVIASALGNSVVFSWRYEDNYSAGPQVASVAGDNNSTNYWPNNTPYCDYYGKMYYYNFDIQQSGQIPSDVTEQTDIGTSLPFAVAKNTSSGYYSTLEYQPYIMRKDSREVLQINAQIQFVTNQKNMIIGSSFAQSCALVHGSDSTLKPKVYVFSEKLNKFINHVEGSVNVVLDNLPSANVSSIVNGKSFTINFTVPANGLSWAIVTNQTTENVTVETDTGEIETQVQVKGGNVIIAANQTVTQGQNITVYCTLKHSIYNN